MKSFFQIVGSVIVYAVCGAAIALYVFVFGGTIAQLFGFGQPLPLSLTATNFLTAPLVFVGAVAIIRKVHSMRKGVAA